MQEMTVKWIKPIPATSVMRISYYQMHSLIVFHIGAVLKVSCVEIIRFIFFLICSI